MSVEKILVVEDEKKIADTLKIGFSENGYDCEVAYNGKMGCKLFRENKYGIIILDLNMPGMNGYELCKYIRASNSAIPIIILTSLSGLNNKLEAYNLGADDYITKPFEFKELLLKIKVFLKRTAIPLLAEAKILKAADLEMDLESKEVKRGNKQINLTTKEFQLLQYFLEHKNKIISRQDIALHVWDLNFDTNTNVIDVYINYLRNKIDKISNHKLIHTQVGMGYILKDK